MSFSALPLGYCTNVHPGLTVAAVEAGLHEFTLPVREHLGQPLAAGLWLSRPVVTELQQDPGRLEFFATGLAENDLSCYTLNAFPYGDFHSERVKDTVYQPDWTTTERLDYTFDCARVLSVLLAAGELTEGSLSTVPLGYTGHVPDEPAARRQFEDRCIARLIELAARLQLLESTGGHLIRLAIEPEPRCLLETTEQTLDFFTRLRDEATRQGAAANVERYLGVCFDVCHQAVEFEDVAASIRQLDAAGIRLNKVHITCAIHVDEPLRNEAAREALARFVEPRYLHQTLARLADGTICAAEDLTTLITADPPEPLRSATAWRVHFHVPVNAESLGPLGTTRGDLVQALGEVERLSYAPHLEVETYTWDVLPDGSRTPLVEGIAAELHATHQLLGTVL